MGARGRFFDIILQRHYTVLDGVFEAEFFDLFDDRLDRLFARTYESIHQPLDLWGHWGLPTRVPGFRGIC